MGAWSWAVSESQVLATHQRLLWRDAQGVQGKKDELIRPHRAERDEREHGAIAQRGLALFLGAFAVVNALATLRGRGFGQNVLWIDPRPLPDWAGQPLLFLAGALLVSWCLWPRLSAWRGRVTLAAVVLLGAVAVWNVLGFYRAWVSGDVDPAVPLPLSALVLAAAVWIGWAVWRPAPRRTPAAAWLGIGAVALVSAAAFPLLLMAFFGTTSYAQRADAVVVFGAQVDQSGAPTQSLADRVREGARLQRDAVVPLVIVSGGRGDGGRHECDAMRDYAERLGVPSQAIVEDRGGVSTQATVDDTVTLFRRDGVHDALVVSQFYHLPRIKMAYQRAGTDVRTVPAPAQRYIKQTPIIVAREIPAFWLYYLRGLVS